MFNGKTTLQMNEKQDNGSGNRKEICNTIFLSNFLFKFSICELCHKYKLTWLRQMK